MPLHNHTLRRPRIAYVARGAPLLVTGTHNVLIGSVSLSEESAQARLHFVISSNGAAARSALLLRGQPEERETHDLVVLHSLLRASGRRIENSDLSGLLQAVCGLRARVKLRVLPSGFAIVEEVLA